MIDDSTKLGRALAYSLEPFAASGFMAPESYEEYERLGFGPSPLRTQSGVNLPNAQAYFCTRIAVLGRVSGQLAASVLAIFDPSQVVPAVEHGWALVEPQTMIEIRVRGATAQLTRILGEEPDGINRALELLEATQDGLLPEGRPMSASLRAQPMPETKLGRAWRLADILREYRSDSHIAAWTSEGLAAIEIEMLTDLFIGVPVGVAPPLPWQWSPEQRNAAQHRLRERGLITDVGLSEDGQALRERIEVATDRQYRPVIDALGEDVDELMRIVTPWSAAVQAGRGYIAGLDDWLGATASSR